MGGKQSKAVEISRANPNPLIDTGINYSKALGKVMIYNLNKQENDSGVIHSKVINKYRKPICSIK